MNAELEQKRTALYESTMGHMGESQKEFALACIMQSVFARDVTPAQKIEVFLALASFAERFDQLNKEYGVSK